MAALHTFKLLATRCTAAPPPSPSRSPAPPCFRLHGRHRGRHHLKKKTRTLRRLISSPDPNPDADPDLYDPEGEGGGDREERKGLLMRDSGRTLRDLFVSSPKGKGVDGCGGGCEERGATAAAVAGGGGGGGGGGGRGGGGGWRFVGVRNRLLRRAWRPVLVAIPE